MRTNVKYVNMAALWWRWCPRYAPFRARLRILGVMRPRLRPASVRRTYLGSVSFFSAVARRSFEFINFIATTFAVIVETLLER